MTKDLETKITTSLHRAGDRAPVPPDDFGGVVARHRSRKAHRRLTGALVVVAVLATTGFAIVREQGDSSHSVTLGTAPSAGDPPTQNSPSRPVLDNCTPTSAHESHVDGAPFSVPPEPTEVFADPTRGLNGPLAAVLLSHGTGDTSPPDGAGGGLAANGDINGREARVVVYPNSYGLAERGGATWDLADGGSGMVYSLGLTLDELRAFTTQIDSGTGSFPEGMKSIGMATTADIATSICDHVDGDIPRIITEVRGSLASRYAEMLDTTGDIHFQLFDTDHSSIAIWGSPGQSDPADRSYHQATPDEWSRLLLAGQQPATPNDASPSTTTTP